MQEGKIRGLNYCKDRRYGSKCTTNIRLASDDWNMEHILKAQMRVLKTF